MASATSLESSFNLNGFSNRESKVIEKKNLRKSKTKKINPVKAFHRDDGEDSFPSMVKIDYVANKKDYASCYKDFAAYTYVQTRFGKSVDASCFKKFNTGQGARYYWAPVLINRKVLCWRSRPQEYTVKQNSRDYSTSSKE